MSRCRFRTVFAPFSAVYRRARQPENAVAPGFCGIGPADRRLKTAKTVETAQRPFQSGLRFSAKARGPSTVSSLLVIATKAG